MRDQNGYHKQDQVACWVNVVNENEKVISLVFEKESGERLRDTLTLNKNKSSDKHPDFKGEHCAAWVKLDKNGDKYLSMVMEFVKGIKDSVNAFKNKYKKDEKHPDFRGNVNKKEAVASEPVKTFMPQDFGL